MRVEAVIALPARPVRVSAPRRAVDVRDGLAVLGAKGLLFPDSVPVGEYTKALASDFGGIPEERKQKLEKLALFVRSKRAAGAKVRSSSTCLDRRAQCNLGSGAWLDARCCVVPRVGGDKQGASSPQAGAGRACECGLGPWIRGCDWRSRAR